MASRPQPTSSKRHDDPHAWARHLLELFEREDRLLAQLADVRRAIDAAFGISKKE